MRIRRLLQDLGFELVDLFADRLQGGEEAVGQRIEYPVDDELLTAFVLAPQALPQRSQLREWSLVQRDDEAAADEHVNLDQHFLFSRATLGAGAVVDEEYVVLVVLQLRALTELASVLEGQRVIIEQLVQQVNRLGRR